MPVLRLSGSFEAGQLKGLKQEGVNVPILQHVRALSLNVLFLTDSVHDPCRPSPLNQYGKGMAFAHDSAASAIFESRSANLLIVKSRALKLIKLIMYHF